MSTIRICTFGGLQIFAPDGRAVSIPSRKAQALLVYLAMTPGRPQPRDKLAAMLWEDRAPVQARASLRQEIFVLRKMFGLTDDDFVSGGIDGIAFKSDRFDVDAIAFDRLIARGGPDALERAAALYHGAFLEAFNAKSPAFEGWLLVVREQLAAAAAKALIDLLALRTAAGATAAAIETALRLVSFDPLQEIGHRALMQLYASTGQTSLALRQFQVCREILARELGVRPEAETEQLFRSIQTQRRGVEPVPAWTTASVGSVTGTNDAPVRPSAAESDQRTAPPELRQVTVVSAELVHVDGLDAENDPERLQIKRDDFASAVRAVVEEYGGMVDRQVDGRVIAFFGIPVAHTNDPERAVRAALDIVANKPAAAGARIGIAGGRALVILSGGGSAHALSVTGDAIQRAAVLGDSADPAEIIVADATFSTLSRLAEGAEPRQVAMRSPQRPLAAWRVHRLHEPGTSHLRSRLVGRQTQTTQFAAALQACRQVGRGMTWYVRGEAGIGKTRLVEELRGLAVDAGFGWHAGLVLDFGASWRRNAICAIIESLLEEEAGADEVGTSEQEAERLTRLLDADRQVHLYHLLQRPMPPALRALYDAMDNSARATGQRDALADLIRHASENRPIVIVIEDVHWADDVTLSQVATLAAGVATCPAILIATARNDSEPLSAEWRATTGGAPQVTVDLGPLHRQDAIMLAGELSPGNDEFIVRCVERAGGNPLFLEQLIGVGDTNQQDAPSSVQSLVLARMDALAPRDRQALRAAAVLGQLFQLEALHRLVDDTSYSCRSLVERGLLRPMGTEYLFNHALLRDGIYSSLPRSERQRLHRLAAEWFAALDPLVRAEHLDNAAAPEAARAYLEAALHETAHYRQDRALAAVDRGLALKGDTAQRAELLCCRGDILQASGAVREAQQAYDEAASSGPTEEVQCRILLGLAAVKRITDDLDGALADLAASTAISKRLGLAKEASRAHFLRGNLLFPRGELDACQAEHQQALDLARLAGSVELEATALGGIADAEYMRGRMASAHSLYRRCVEISAENGFGRIAVANRPMIGATLFHLGDLTGMLREALAAAEQARTVVHPRAELIAHTIAYGSLAASLTLDRALEHIEHALALSRQISALRFEAESLVFRGDVHRLAGRSEQALADIDAGLAISRRTGMAYLGPWYLGILAATTGQPEIRRAALDEGEALLATNAIGHNHIFFRRYAIEACIRSRDWLSARHHADALDQFTQGEPLPAASFFAQRGRALAEFHENGPSAAVEGELRKLEQVALTAGFMDEVREIKSALDRVG